MCLFAGYVITLPHPHPHASLNYCHLSYITEKSETIYLLLGFKLKQFTPFFKKLMPSSHAEKTCSEILICAVGYASAISSRVHLPSLSCYIGQADFRSLLISLHDLDHWEAHNKLPHGICGPPPTTFTTSLWNLCPQFQFMTGSAIQKDDIPKTILNVSFHDFPTQGQ